MAVYTVHINSTYVLSLYVCMYVSPYHACYRFNVSLTDWPDPSALILFKPFKGDVFRIEDRRPELKYQRAQAAAAP